MLQWIEVMGEYWERKEAWHAESKGSDRLVNRSTP